MALRAFLHNPSIGGFGNESGFGNEGGGLLMIREGQQQEFRNAHQGINNNTSKRRNKNSTILTSIKYDPKSKSAPTLANNYSDAFVQIVKELVDNAVDACNLSSCYIGQSDFFRNDGSKNQSNKKSKSKVLKRVRVSIEKVHSMNPSDNDIHDENDKNEEEGEECNSNLLRVTVTDNGCGMMDIEKCVSAFSSSKGGTGKLETSNEVEDCSTNNQEIKGQTVGRYGIGLTLCLLHAQRLVPDSYTSITSSTSSQKAWTVAKFVVDAERDTVVCVEKKTVGKKKNFLDSSGTTISLLVPVSFGF